MTVSFADLGPSPFTEQASSAVIYRWAGKDASETYNSYHSAELIESELEPAKKIGTLDESSITTTWLDAQAQASNLNSSLAAVDTDPSAKPPLATLINLDDFEKAFAKSGSSKSNAYISGASNDLLTLRANALHWQKLWFRPLVLKNVSKINTRTHVFGQDLSMPVWIAPMGIAKTAGPEGEAALGAGAKAAEILHCMSTTTSMSTEEILRSAPGHPWIFQLYVDKQRAKTEALLKKLAGQTQIKAIFVTGDLAVVSKREADERMQILARPPSVGGGTVTTGLARKTGSFIDPALDWDDLAWLRNHTRLPIVIKGVQSASDARRALQMGCAGIVVSNHGGRALDGAPSAVMVLLELRRDCPEVFEYMEVFVDGGIRRGSDILKAVCLGARAVGVGRPFQCAVSYGTEGVTYCASSKPPHSSHDKILEKTESLITRFCVVLKDELETAMRLCGVTDIDAVRGDMSFLNTAELDVLLPPRGTVYPPLRTGWKRILPRL